MFPILSHGLTVNASCHIVNKLVHHIKSVLLGPSEVSGCDSTISDSFNLGNCSLNHLNIMDTGYIDTVQVCSFLSWLMDTHISNSCSLGNGVDSKQTRVGVISIESTDLFKKRWNGKKWQRFKVLNLLFLDEHIYVANWHHSHRRGQQLPWQQPGPVCCWCRNPSWRVGQLPVHAAGHRMPGPHWYQLLLTDSPLQSEPTC